MQAVDETVDKNIAPIEGVGTIDEGTAGLEIVMQKHKKGGNTENHPKRKTKVCVSMGRLGRM